MNGLNGFGLSYAWSIIAITIIKILFWPLTKASTVSMKRMSAYQPQMAEIREKYKSDPQKMNRKIMEFMREHKINPMEVVSRSLFSSGFLWFLHDAPQCGGIVWAEFLGFVICLSPTQWHTSSASRSTQCRCSWRLPCWFKPG